MKTTGTPKKQSTLRKANGVPRPGVPDRDLTGFREAMEEAGFTGSEEIEPWVMSAIECDTDLMVELATRWDMEGVPVRTAVTWCEVLPSWAWSPARAAAWTSAGYEPQEAWFTALLIGMAHRMTRPDSPVSSESQWLSSGLMPSQAALALASGCTTVHAARELASTIDGDRGTRAHLEMTAAFDGLHVREFRIDAPRGR